MNRLKYLIILVFAAGTAFASLHNNTPYTYTFSSGEVVECAAVESTTVDSIDTARWDFSVGDYNTYNAIPFRFISHKGDSLRHSDSATVCDDTTGFGSVGGCPKKPPFYKLRVYSFNTNSNIKDTLLKLDTARTNRCTTAVLDTTLAIQSYNAYKLRVEIISTSVTRKGGYLKWAMQLRRMGY